MKCVSKIQESWGDRCVYEVDESEIKVFPCYSNGKQIGTFEGIMVQKNYSQQPERITRKDGKAFIEIFHSIGD